MEYHFYKFPSPPPTLPPLYLTYDNYIYLHLSVFSLCITGTVQADKGATNFDIFCLHLLYRFKLELKLIITCPGKESEPKEVNKGSKQLTGCAGHTALQT
jgi:hypothetical protein